MIIDPAGGTFSGAVDTPANDFAILAGVDTDASKDLAQTKLIDGPIAKRYSLVGDQTGALLWDRIVLRNRLAPGSGSLQPYHAIAQALLVVEGSSGADTAGLAVNATAPGGWRATVLPATMLGVIGFADGQVPTGTYSDVRDGQPVVTFYAAGGTQAQNNVLKFTYDGTPVTCQFTDAAGVAIPTGGSADVPLGPISSANTILSQIATAMATALGVAPAVVIAARLVQEEGAGIRLVSSVTDTSSSIVMGSDSATARLGFVDGAEVTRTPVEAKTLAAALMSHSHAAIADVLFWTTALVPGSGYFAADGLAGIEVDASNAEYLYLQSQANPPGGPGTSSTIVFDEAASDSVLLPGVGLGVVDGDGAAGEAGISGYYVTSSDPVDGSGTANTSVLNSGTGQDGIINQTYRDLVTGLTFTILEREGGSNYPAGQTFTIPVRRVVTTDSNIPVNTIPGIELLVMNTLNIGAGDTAIVSTYERSGNQPSIGDSYFASYNYAKQDFSTQLFTKFAAIEAEYGANGPEHPVTLASYLAILNGAVLIGIKQVEKDIDEDNDGVMDTASINAFITAVDELEGPLPGGLLPNILIPLDAPSASTTTFFEYIARHADIQSTIRHAAERTVIAGFPAGTSERSAGDVAEAVQRSRLRVVYPDIATLSLTQADATEEEFLIDGSYLASMLAGSVVQPATDVATPWTGRKLFGIVGLARTLNAVQENQLAVRGVTVLTTLRNVIKVRQGFTTDMSNVLTKTPTVIQIADEVQQQARVTLDRFIGIKYLPGVLSQIEGQLSNTLKLLVKAEILTAYTGVRATPDETDVTTALVEAFYSPVFPLLYIIVTFHLRSQL